MGFLLSKKDKKHRLSFSQTIDTNAGGKWAHLAGVAVGYIYIKHLQKV